MREQNKREASMYSKMFKFAPPSAKSTSAEAVVVPASEATETLTQVAAAEAVSVVPEESAPMEPEPAPPAVSVA